MIPAGLGPAMRDMPESNQSSFAPGSRLIAGAMISSLGFRARICVVGAVVASVLAPQPTCHHASHPRYVESNQKGPYRDHPKSENGEKSKCTADNE